jgi:hypothetical protein
METRGAEPFSKLANTLRSNSANTHSSTASESLVTARAWVSRRVEVANSRGCLLYEYRHIEAMTSFVHPRRSLFRAGCLQIGG